MCVCVLTMHFLHNTMLRTLLTNNLSTYLSKYKKSNVHLYSNVK